MHCQLSCNKLPHLLSPDQQSTKIRESEGKYLNYLYTSEGGVTLSSFFCKIVFATSKLCPLSAAKVCVILGTGAGGAKPSRTSKILCGGSVKTFHHRPPSTGAMLCIQESGKSIAFLQELHPLKPSSFPLLVLLCDSSSQLCFLSCFSDKGKNNSFQRETITGHRHCFSQHDDSLQLQNKSL